MDGAEHEDAEEESAAALLEGARLGHYAEAIEREGYVFSADLIEAEAEELAALAERLELKPPEARRLRKAIAIRGGSAGTPTRAARSAQDSAAAALAAEAEEEAVAAQASARQGSRFAKLAAGADLQGSLYSAAAALDATAREGRERLRICSSRSSGRPITSRRSMRTRRARCRRRS